MGKRGFLSWLFLGLLVAVPVFLPISPALAQDCTDPDGAEGSFGYHKDYGVFMGCTATGWVAWHPATRTPPSDPCLVEPLSPGTVCSDGTVYAGNSPIAGTPKMFVTPCDVGMVWNGTECTGTRLTRRWKTTNTTTSGTSSDDGKINTNAMITAGIAQHPAGEQCVLLNQGAGTHGHNDWYLPSLPELVHIFMNSVAIGNFDTGGAWYKGSTEFDATIAWILRFDTGSLSGSDKITSHYVRCARR